MDMWLSGMGGGKGLARRGTAEHLGGQLARDIWLFHCGGIYSVLCCQKSQNGAPKPNFIFCK